MENRSSKYVVVVKFSYYFVTKKFTSYIGKKQHWFQEYDITPDPNFIRPFETVEEAREATKTFWNEVRRGVVNGYQGICREKENIQFILMPIEKAMEEYIHRYDDQNVFAKSN